MHNLIELETTPKTSLVSSAVIWPKFGLCLCVFSVCPHPLTPKPLQIISWLLSQKSQTFQTFDQKPFLVILPNF